MQAIRRINEALCRRPEIAIWLIAGYYLLAIALRVLRSEGLQNDEAEQLFQSQFLLLGYGRQPPFYNWLQYGVIQLIGPSILALSLLKNLLLFLTCLIYGLAARVVLEDRRLGVIAMLGLVSMPVISILAQRDLTHAVATLFCVSLFTWSFLTTLKRPSLGFYLLTGAAVGIGVIAKYNFVVLPVAAILAILPDAELRKRVLDWRFVAALAVATVIVLPHGLWVLSNLAEATSDTIDAMRRDASGNAVFDRLAGLGALVNSVVAGTLPILAFFLVAFRRPFLSVWRASNKSSNRWTGVIGRTILFSLIIIGLIGIGFGATTISEKWLSPFLALLPLYLCLKLDAFGIDTRQSMPRMFWPVMALTVGFIVYLVIGNIVGPRLNQYSKENLPPRPFVAQLVQTRGERPLPEIVITSDYYLAGSARIELPQALVLLPGLLPAQQNGAVIGRKPALMIWTIGEDGNAVVPFSDWLANQGIDPTRVTTGTMAVPYIFSSGRKTAVFGYGWIDP